MKVQALADFGKEYERQAPGVLVVIDPPEDFAPALELLRARANVQVISGVVRSGFDRSAFNHSVFGAPVYGVVTFTAPAPKGFPSVVIGPTTEARDGLCAVLCPADHDTAATGMVSVHDGSPAGMVRAIMAAFECLRIEEGCRYYVPTSDGYWERTIGGPDH